MMSDYDPDETVAREDLCRFLSACYYEPAAEFVEEKLFENMLIAARRLDPYLAEHARRLGDAFAAQDIETLLVDYTRLFLGPVQALASPYGESWLSSSAPTQDTPPLAVLELYRQGGFEIDEEFRERPDHVAVELEFLYLLTFNQNHAATAGKSEEAVALQWLKQRFLAEHLGAWIAPFAAAMASGAQSAFYRELGALTERFVRMQAGMPTLH
jgi:TorA maturation chaperone TorD